MIVLFQICNTIFEWYYVKQLSEPTSNYSDSFSIFWQTQREMQATSDTRASSVSDMLNVVKRVRRNSFKYFHTYSINTCDLFYPIRMML